MLRRAVALLIQETQNRWLRVPARAADPYSTHVPVLSVLSALRTVRSVLEFGSGRHSTRLFLDSKVFPALQRLASFENDPQWLESLRREFASDPRLLLREAVGPMSQIVRAAELGEYDLIFVDDSQSEEHRCDTIREIAQACPRGPLVVIHDYEVASYRAAARSFEHRVRITAINPNVGILWNGDADLLGTLKRIDPLLRRHLRETPVSHGPEWRSLAEREFQGRA